MRDRIIRPAILHVINSEAKSFIRSTFNKNDDLFVSYITQLHSWRHKPEAVWSRLFELERNLSSKKPRSTPVRDWRARLEEWRRNRTSLANGADLDHGYEHLWIMRCLDTHSREPWYAEFRKQMAADELEGKYILEADDLWKKLEFEETHHASKESPFSQHVNMIGNSQDGRNNGRKRPQDSDFDTQDRNNRFSRYDNSRQRDSGRGRGKDSGTRRPGQAVWSKIGFAHDFKTLSPNDRNWKCRICNNNPCIKFCRKCLQTCNPSHQNGRACPYALGTGARKPATWDYSRPCR